MKKNEIQQGGVYEAKVSGKLTRVRVDRIMEVFDYKRRPAIRYRVTNLRTGRKTTFRSAVKFRREVQPNRDTQAMRDRIVNQMLGHLPNVVNIPAAARSFHDGGDGLAASLRLIELDSE